jgi:hypothetical protein
VIQEIASWWYVQSSEVAVSRERVGVDWVMPPGLITTEPLPATVVAELRGSRHALRLVDREALRLTVALGEVSMATGDYVVELTGAPVAGLPPGVQVDDIRPGNLAFSLDDVEERALDVRPVVVGQPREDWMVVGTRVEPAVVEVRGPRAALAGMVAVDTLPIDVSGLLHDRRFDVGLDVPRGVQVMGSGSVEARVDVEPQVESRIFTAVPLFVRDGRGWVTSPASILVRVQGPAASLRQIRDRDVVGQIFLPDPANKARYVAGLGESPEARLEISLPSLAVRVVEIEPTEIEVVRP